MKSFKKLLSSLSGLTVAGLALLVLAAPAEAAIGQSQGTTDNQTVTESVTVIIDPYISLEINTAGGFSHTLTNAGIKTARAAARDYTKKFYSLFGTAFGLVADSNNNAGWKVQAKIADLSDGTNTLAATSMYISNASVDTTKTNITGYANINSSAVGNSRGRIGDTVTDLADETSTLGFGLTTSYQDMLGSATNGSTTSAKPGRMALTAKLGLLYDTNIAASATGYVGEISFVIVNL